MNKLALLRFDVRHGIPTAVSVLATELGWFAALRVLVEFVIAGVRDPFRALGSERQGPRERFTRHQLRPVLILHRVLSRRLPPGRVLVVLGKVVAQSGARFVKHNVEHPQPSLWRRMSKDKKKAFAQRILSRFGNAETTLVETAEDDFAFDVTRCHFVDLTRRLDRTELAPLFCAADAAFYGDPKVPIDLARDKTIAGGDTCCTFRFRFRESD